MPINTSIPNPTAVRVALSLIWLIFSSCSAPEENLGCVGSDCVDAATSCEPAAQLYINELMVKNTSGILDEAEEADDWIEIYNASNDSVDLGGMFFTDKPEEPTRFQIPPSDPEATTIAAGEYLILWADKDAERGVLHLGIKLSSQGESVSLYDIDGQSLIDHVEFSAQQEDISLGRFPDGCHSWTKFDPPTPGSANQ